MTTFEAPLPCSLVKVESNVESKCATMTAVIRWYSTKALLCFLAEDMWSKAQVAEMQHSVNLSETKLNFSLYNDAVIT